MFQLKRFKIDLFTNFHHVIDRVIDAVRPGRRLHVPDAARARLAYYVEEELRNAFINGAADSNPYVGPKLRKELQQIRQTPTHSVQAEMLRAVHELLQDDVTIEPNTSNGSGTRRLRRRH